MRNKIKVSIIGGSGYTGGELLRLLLSHPYVEILQVSSEQYAGKPVYRVHPNLRKKTSLVFCSITEVKNCDLIFLALPHGRAMTMIKHFMRLASKIIDLSGDFRLKNPEDYKIWYEVNHPHPELLKEFVYGVAEIHREEIKNSNFIACAGCNSTATILPLYPLYLNNLVGDEGTVVEVKTGTSQGGHKYNIATHHPERANSIRAYKPTGHRHIAEIRQELRLREDQNLHFTATSVNLVRGIHVVSHVFLKDKLKEKDIWGVYRQTYSKEPFIRIVKEKLGIHRFPDPKILWGTNFCDIGFEIDPYSNRMVVYSAVDNLMKGAAGQAVQAFNIMMGLNEKTGLEFPGLHPV